MYRFTVLFDQVEDPRASNARHSLTSILFIALAATLSGAQTCADMAVFAEEKLDLLAEMVDLPHGPPSHDTFSRVFRLIETDQFEAAFRSFAQAFAQEIGGIDGVVALDGKSLRRAYEKGEQTTPLHIVTAWAADQRIVLGQRVATGRAEVRATLELVSMLRLKGSIVTADALHGTRDMAAAVRAKSGHYVLALKGNRGPLYRATVGLLDDVPPGDAACRTDIGHGRHEERRAWVRPVPAAWASQYGMRDLTAVARIDSVRQVADRPEQGLTRYFMLSRTMPADQALRVVRAHWTIENRLHWLLDVVFDEDQARSRKDHAGPNLALIRRIALSILQRDPRKGSLRGKMKRAGWTDAYLKDLLSQMR